MKLDVKEPSQAKQGTPEVTNKLFQRGRPFGYYRKRSCVYTNDGKFCGQVGSMNDPNVGCSSCDKINNLSRNCNNHSCCSNERCARLMRNPNGFSPYTDVSLYESHIDLYGNTVVTKRQPIPQVKTITAPRTVYNNSNTYKKQKYSYSITEMIKNQKISYKEEEKKLSCCNQNNLLCNSIQMFVGVFNGDVIIRNMYDVKKYENLTKINGNLIIIEFDEEQIINIFPVLTEVVGSLTIQNNTILKFLTGFNRLETTGGEINIINNNGLEIISGFNLFKKDNGNLNISSNSSLTRVEGFENLISVNNRLQIQDNTNLTSIPEFNSLETLTGDLTIEKNSELKTIPRFNNIITVTGNVTITGNHEDCGCIASGITLRNDADANILSAYVKRVYEGITIDDTFDKSVKELTDIFPYLETIFGNPFVDFDDPALDRTFRGSPALLSVLGKTFEVIETPRGGEHCADGVTLLPNPGSIIINNTNLVSITGFNSLINAPSLISITIENNVHLKIIPEFNSLTSIGSIFIFNNKSIETLKGFNTFTEIDFYLIIENNVQLKTISGFQSVTAITTGDVKITGNDDPITIENEFLRDLVLPGP